MKKVGIREARQNLSRLIEAVKRGQEVVITDRGVPVARLSAPPPGQGKKFRNHARFRSQMPVLHLPLSHTILEERED